MILIDSLPRKIQFYIVKLYFMSHRLFKIITLFVMVPYVVGIITFGT